MSLFDISVSICGLHGACMLIKLMIVPVAEKEGAGTDGVHGVH